MHVTPRHFIVESSPHDRSAAAIRFRARRAARADERERQRQEAELRLTAESPCGPEAPSRRGPFPSARSQPAPCS
jgi:hypothetical protein